jgi:hypothetical protein
LNGIGFKDEFATSGHGVSRVDCEVEHNLIELAGIGFDNGGGGAAGHYDLDIVTH